MSISLEIVEKRVADLRENPFSIEIYGDDDISDLLESIAEKGIQEPLVIKPDGTIISGHRRYRAVKKLLEEGKITNDVVPCRIVSTQDEIEEKDLIITFNKQRKKTHFQLMRECDVIEEIEMRKARERKTFGKNLPGVELGKVRDLLADKIGYGKSGVTLWKERVIWKAAKQGDSKAQELSVKLEKGEISVSDAYQQLRYEEKIKQKKQELQKIQELPLIVNKQPLIFGDCIEEMKKMPEGFVALVLTDPPYSIEKEVRSHRAVNPLKFDPANETINKELRTFDYFKDDEEYYEFTAKWIAECFRVLKPGGHLVTWVDRLKVTRIKEIGESVGLHFRQCLFWKKTNPVPMAGKTGFADAIEEMLWFIKPGGEPTFNIELGVHSNCFEAPIVQPRIHPTEKPVDVLKVIINYLTNESDVVLDPFAGSGSTLVAALELKRKPIGIEKDELYYKTTLQRLSEL